MKSTDLHITDRMLTRVAPALAAVLLTACGAGGPGAPTPAASAEAAAATITAADMARHIGALAHDSTAGRDTPSPELEEVAVYLTAQLEAAGLQPAGENGTFIDRYDLSTATLVPEQTFVGVAGSDETATYGVDYFLIPPPSPVEARVHYMGIAGETPPPPAEARGQILVYQHPGATVDQEWQTRLMAALQPSVRSGAAGVVFILAPGFPAETVGQLATVTASQAAPLGVMGITHEAGRELIADLGHDLAALEAAGEPRPLGDRQLAVRGERRSDTSSPPNVVAMLPGSDPELRDSYVVITAHFDHDGVGAPDETGDSIFNGADDNASGTAAVLEIAEAFAALGVAPARSVVFLLVSGEEKGLLGSRAWVENPTVSIGGIVANINMDMIGRNHPDTVIGIGQEYSTLEAILAEIAATRPDVGLEVILDPKPEEMYFFRSDQLPFIQRDIPAVFFTTGDHDDYHKQSDEAARIDNDKAARVARLGFYLAHAIATSATAPEWTEEGRARIQEMLTPP